MKTRLYPMVQFKKDTWEIDEFECASVFVLVGKEKAMVIDAKHLAKRCHRGKRDLSNQITFLYCCLSNKIDLLSSY